MNIFFSWTRFAGCALILSAAAHSSHAQNGPVYRFSPVNQYGLELTASYWNPIIDYVSKKSGIKLQLKIGRTSADTTAYVLAHEVEFVFSNHLFSPERDNLGWKVFGRRDAPPIRAQIVVLPDSPIQSLEQLADKNVAFPGPEALVAYKVVYANLLSRNVSVQVLFGGNMDGAFAQLVSGKASAVGTHTQLSSGWASRENQPLRVLWQSEPFEDLALMAVKTVPPKDLQAISRAFLAMSGDPQGQKILTDASRLVKLPRTAGFVQSNGSEYSAYRDFYKSAPPNLR